MLVCISFIRAGYAYNHEQLLDFIIISQWLPCPFALVLLWMEALLTIVNVYGCRLSIELCGFCLTYELKVCNNFLHNIRCVQRVYQNVSDVTGIHKKSTKHVDFFY